MSYVADGVSRDMVGWLRITAGCLVVFGVLLAWDWLYERREVRKQAKRIEAELVELLRSNQR